MIAASRQSPFKEDASGMQQIKTILNWILPSTKWAYRILSASAEAFCHHSFGSRYIWNLMLSFFSCCIYFAIMSITGSGDGISGCYLMAYFGFVVYHTVSAFRRDSLVHSESNGVPWDFWRLTPEQMGGFQIFIEPLLFLNIGLLIAQLDAPLGAWLLGCAICHFIKAIITSWNHRNRLLDALDARLEGERMSNSVRGQHSPRRQDRPSTVTVAQSLQRPHNARDIVNNLDPVLRRLMTEEGAGAPVRYHAGPLGHLPRITARKPNQN